MIPANSRSSASAAPTTPGSRVAFGKVDFSVQIQEPSSQEEFAGEGALDATILRQVPVSGRADIAAQLAERPRGASLLKVAGESPEDRQAHKLNLLLDIVKELSQQTEVDRLLDRIVGLTFQVMSVDRVAVMTAKLPSAANVICSKVRNDAARPPLPGT